MREKIEIANRFRVFRERFSKNSEKRKIITKCYHAYVIQCLIVGKESFTIRYGSYYHDSLINRVVDWCCYGTDYVYQFFSAFLAPRAKKAEEKYKFEHYRVNKPMHIKLAYCVDEIFLYGFLQEVGFEIVDEELASLSSSYKIAQNHSQTPET